MHLLFQRGYRLSRLSSSIGVFARKITFTEVIGLLEVTFKFEMRVGFFEEPRVLYARIIYRLMYTNLRAYNPMFYI